ncbi:hypothetical protein RYZ26_07540 [Terasakiella sp. A23]|uniref:hypothetical protein n=1 Tax=Terasakiella sp. FCG-A23 TaxID=3080561 RepID=UPI002954337E|nr:hypothetical protein [Terasakiella sp. A23]MDV7339439.1 hypothetical protein [Terasakiella sp. A23]
MKHPIAYRTDRNGRIVAQFKGGLECHAVDVEAQLMSYALRDHDKRKNRKSESQTS